jgi:hypothetical protein
MVISYLARVPDPSTLWWDVGLTWPRDYLSPVSASGECHAAYLIGRFGKSSRDVCREYYTSLGHSPPYIALAACGHDLEAAMTFTQTWGPLGRSIPLPEGLLNSVRYQPWLDDGADFCADLEGWLYLKGRFDQLISLAEKGTRQSRDEIAAFFRAECVAAGDAGHFGLELAWKQHEFASTVTEQCMPCLVADSLYLAFVAMVWLDFAVEGRRLLRCANPRCGQYFSSENPTQLYCQGTCAQNVARRNWWNNKGSERRKQAKAAKAAERVPPVPLPRSQTGQTPAQATTTTVRSASRRQSSTGRAPEPIQKGRS